MVNNLTIRNLLQKKALLDGCLKEIEKDRLFKLEEATRDLEDKFTREIISISRIYSRKNHYEKLLKD